MVSPLKKSRDKKRDKLMGIQSCISQLISDDRKNLDKIDSRNINKIEDIFFAWKDGKNIIIKLLVVSK